MPTGQEISIAFIREVLWPLLEERIGKDASRLAVAVIGTGSDVLGLDDEISRDHHWGPRANVMLLPGEDAKVEEGVRQVVETALPADYLGFPIATSVRIMTGVCYTRMDDFFRYFLGTADLPECDLDWLKLCEVDLFHVTHGVVAVDGPGELTRRREALSYYPDNVWKKRIADWCMYVTGRDAPYNLYRLAKRGDDATAAIYKAQFCKQALELLFMLNRQYAPYTKWLYRLGGKLPRYASDLIPMIRRVHEEPDLVRNVHQMIAVNHRIADALFDLGLTGKPKKAEFDEGLTDLTLYDSAAQIYNSLPGELLAPSFNRVELWERLARDVLFDTNDYFLRRSEDRRED